MAPAPKVRIAIDRGGTFTDIHATRPGEPDIVLKLLSVDPGNYADAPTEGIRRVLELVTGAPIPKAAKLDLAAVESIRMGTTVATNALLERKGERVALLTTRGFRDLLVIGNQARPSIFDLTVRKLETLYQEVVEVDERVTMEDFSENPEPREIDVSQDEMLFKGLTGEVIRILKKPDVAVVKKDLERLWADGYRSLSLCLLHSYTFPDHEKLIAAEARAMGFDVSVSHELQPMIKMVNRANSATADAYLSPIIKRYITSFGSGFQGGLEAMGHKLLFMQSDGGLCLWSKFSGLRAILSGPAGGVVGYAKTCFDAEDGTATLGFDMGGTSTDVSRYDGKLEHIFETTTAQVTLQSPQLDINTVAAGGGSMLMWRNGLFVVGPESAGAHPGPACYRKGGPLTITDANLFLGRLLPDYFPKIFGPNENEALAADISKAKFEELTLVINAEKDGSQKFTPEEVACGFLKVANESMSRPIRTLTEARGFETSAHNLAVFGGAGGQHACSVAAALGIGRVLVHRFSSILSAYGMALADVIHEVSRPESCVLDASALPHLQDRVAELTAEVNQALTEQGFEAKDIETEVYLNIRYRGSDTTLMILQPADGGWDFAAAFIERHAVEFGFTLEKRDLLVDDIRVRGVGKSEGVGVQSPFQELKSLQPVQVDSKKKAGSEKVYFENRGWMESGVFLLESLSAGDKIKGPAMIIDNTQTILIEPIAEATVLSSHVLIDLVTAEQTKVGSKEVDPIQLSVFGHRFMSIAEQMGRTLQKTSISTNIKERLDFSCAVFGPTGGLVANAPHLPAHLGAMSHAVSYQAELWSKKGGLSPGDVLISNHPIAGGSHLPDITVITPVFDPKTSEILFWTASRGHHADIGGITAGSMPPHSKEIWQEGAMIESFKLVEGGVFQEEGIIDLLYHQPAKYPGCSGTRTLQDNLSDIKAQAAANNKGNRLILGLIEEYGLDVVQFYMDAIQSNAEHAVRELLKLAYKKFNGKPLRAVDYMDDGTPIALNVTIDGDRGQATFDFTGTGPEMYGNLNAPTAIMYSAIIYVLRSLVALDIPLNQGCLIPIDIILPKGTLLSPSASKATVGGNVETSQRITDVVLRAFEACGASQGTCNNFTFGYGGTSSTDGTVTKGFGYYETLCGGSGAGPGWAGQSVTHVHMSNTRITDPETFEKRYPCVLHEFSIRRGSGGGGRWRGGDGCVREIEFRMPLEAAILSERRVIAPYGMCGGEEGARGVNLWIRKEADGQWHTISIGGKNLCKVSAGDRIIIKTPGGGGYGKAEEAVNGVNGHATNGVAAEHIDYPAATAIQNALSGFRASGSVSGREGMQLSA